MVGTQTRARRIDPKSARTLLAVAIFFDLVSIIPIVGEFSGAAAQAILPYMFSKKGVNILTLKRIAPYLVTLFIELVPGINFIPALSIETLYFIYQARKEDRSLMLADQISK